MTVSILPTVRGRGIIVLEHLNYFMRLAELDDLAVHECALVSVLERVLEAVE